MRTVMGRVALLIGSLSLLAACGGAGIGLPDDLGTDLDVDAMIEGLRDCDAISETFVAVVREAAQDIDGFAEDSNGRIPAAELTERVDLTVETAYFEIAERLGCSAVDHRLDTIERLRRLSPKSTAGTDFVDEIIRQLEESGG